MASDKLDAFYAEMLEHHKDLSDPPEGLKEFSRLGFSQDAQGEISGEHSDFERRINKLNAAIAAVSDLASDGYPDMPLEEVSADVVAEMDRKIEVLLAARARFTYNPPTILQVPIHAQADVDDQ